jgi:phosphatidylglycerophosphatase A
VLKPWPASAFDRMKSGFGVVMDDVAAGLYAWAALRVLRALGVLP